ncbi:MAG: hypothetical protein QOG56_1764 [Solirubrobacteraceae bacterium]|nr:hypothetical protein [Solirubrobacteraceae bacterium]
MRPRRPHGGPLRVAFAGQTTFFEACSLQAPAGGLIPRFFEFRAGGDADALLAGLREFVPHVVVVYRPEVVPEGLFGELAAVTLGFLSEPLPRGGPAHVDLQRRLRELEEADVANFDRFVSFDPLIAATAEAVLPIWRSLPLPVADRFFAPVTPMGHPPRVLFVGRSTPHREFLLAPAKLEHDLLHVAFGVSGTELVELLHRHDVAINLHNEDYPSFENRVSMHLAAGHLVLSEALDPLHGLEPGIDFLQIESASELRRALSVVTRFPRVHHRVRVRGRLKAEGFRASRVYPRLIADLLADIDAFGSSRT